MKRRIFEKKYYSFKVGKGLDVPQTTPEPKYLYFINAVKLDGSESTSYRSPAENKEELEKLVAILNDILNYLPLHHMVKTLHTLQEKYSQNHETLLKNVAEIHNDLNYAITKKGKILLGKCKICEQEKDKLKLK